MLEEAIILEPYEEPHDGALDPDPCNVPATSPAIMIPGIAADDTLFPVEKIDAHRRGLHHLAISVFVFDGSALLIQKRAKEKYHCGGQWANTCCTHPHWQERPQDAAMRRVREELGVSVSIEEKRVVEYSADVGGGLWEKERVHMFRAEAKRSDLVLKPDPDEVDETKWVEPDELLADVRQTPHRYTPWFRIYLNRFPDLQF